MRLTGPLDVSRPGVTRAWSVRLRRTFILAMSFAVAMVTASYASPWSADRRWNLTADQTFFVDAVLGDDANDCLGPGSGACKTPQAAMNHVADDVDGRGHVVTISLAAGQTFASALVKYPTLGIRGMAGVKQLVIEGGGSALITSSTWDAIDTQSLIDSGVLIQNIHLSSSAPTNLGQGFAVLVQHPAGIAIGNGVTFLACTGGHIGAQDAAAIVQLAGNYTIAGGAPTHLNAAVGGQIIQGQGAEVTLTGTPNFSIAFALSFANGLIYTSSSFLSFRGAATGSRYYIQLNSVIFTGGAGTGFFPGSGDGYVMSGGQYY